MSDTYGFSLPDVKRIGKAVRLVERDEPRRDLGGDTDDTVSRGVRLLIAKFEGSAWATATTATVMIYGGYPPSSGTAIQLASAYTIAAANQFLKFSTNASCTQHWIALGNNGYGWQVISKSAACTATCSMEVSGVDFSVLPNYANNVTQILGHDASGCIRWYDTTNCSTAT